MSSDPAQVPAPAPHTQRSTYAAPVVVSAGAVAFGTLAPVVMLFAKVPAATWAHRHGRTALRNALLIALAIVAWLLMSIFLTPRTASGTVGPITSARP